MSDTNIKTIKGFADLFPPESTAFTRMEEVARRVFGNTGYGELRTPLLERTELFCRSIGTETDVVQKEMYTFEDRKGRSLTLRPEATAGVMRAYLESGKYGSESVTKLYTFGPMFRYERPQKGRMRQFHQINCECLGAQGAHTDAEVITMLMTFLDELGLKNLELHMNSLGCAECRPHYRKVLYDYLSSLDPSALCEDCRRRMQTNPLRVLDCKVPSCKEHTEKAPTLLESNCPHCQSHFATVTDLLKRGGIDWVLDNRLVRGLDYYCRTTFEVVSGAIGAQSSVAGGGRYDGLIKALGGPDVPGIGFACGMERLALLLPELKPKAYDFFIVCVDASVKDEAFLLASRLRQAGFSGDLSHAGTGFKGQMRQAGKCGAHFALVLGPDELGAQSIVVKNMGQSSQESIKLENIVAYFRDKLQK
ncbi:MAG: histidine--tRNA ligase [Desulfovibrionaceae bacterium]